MSHYETINDILVNLFNEIWDIEEKALITDQFKDISVNDMHIMAVSYTHLTLPTTMLV